MCPEILSIRRQWFFCVPFIRRCFESLLRMKIEFRSNEYVHLLPPDPLLAPPSSPCHDNFFLDNIYKIIVFFVIRRNDDKKYRRFGYYVGYLITDLDKY